MRDERRRLLELLVASDEGCTESLLLAHGFALELIESIEDAGLVTAQAERTFAVDVRSSSHGCGSLTQAGERWWNEKKIIPTTLSRLNKLPN